MIKKTLDRDHKTHDVRTGARFGPDNGPFGCSEPLKHMHTRGADQSGFDGGLRRPKTGSRVSADILHGNYRARPFTVRTAERGLKPFYVQQNSVSYIFIIAIGEKRV